MGWILPVVLFIIAAGGIYLFIRLAQKEEKKLNRKGKKRKDDVLGQIKQY